MSAESQLAQPFSRLLAGIHDRPEIAVSAIRELEKPLMGHSGSDARVYEVEYGDGTSAHETTRIVIKNAVPLEQQILHLLTQQKQAIPATLIPELRTDQRAPVYMQYARSRPLDDAMGTFSSHEVRGSEGSRPEVAGPGGVVN